jgi:serine/threonine-protein kinase
VPKIIGLADSDALKTLQDAGFTPVAGPSRFDKNVALGKVIEQNPAPDTLSPKGSQVTYIVSKGTEMAVVPDVTGASKSSAISQLESAGFRYSTSTDFSDSVSAGRVISQDPSGGGSYAPKTVVSIVISDGKGVKVPSVIDSSATDAKNIIESVGLTFKKGSGDTSGTVVTSQSPNAGKTVSPGASVTCNFGAP